MKKDRSHCPVNFSLEIFGDKWTLLILRDLILFKKRTFKALCHSPEGIATNILSNRLKQLENNGIITKQLDPQNSKIFHYGLTPKGKDLIPILLEMSVWGATYDPKTIAPSHIIDRIKNDRQTVHREILESLDGVGEPFISHANAD